jgi:predicted exporter
MSHEPSTIFGRLARWVLHNQRTTRAVALLCAVISALAVTRIRVDSDVLHLMPEDEPTIIALKDLEQREAGVSLVTVAVTGEPEATDAFLSELRDRLQDDERFRYVLYDIEADLAWRIGVLQLSPEELGAIRDRITGALALGPAVANPFVAARILDLGPMTEKLKDRGRQGSSGVLSSEGVARLVIRPVHSAHDIPFARGIMGTIDEEIAALDPAASGVEIAWIGGAYRHNVEDFEGILYDMRWTSIASLVLVLGFVAIAFRDLRAVALIFAPLLLSTLCTFGFAALSVGTLNNFTSFFGAILLGLGVDFSIHLYTRYREERANSDTLEEAITRAWDKVGPPCLAAAVTTAGGFTALMFAHFKGFSQLGLLLAVGVMICLVSVLAILPLLIQWRERAPASRHKEPDGPGRARPPTYRFAPLGLLLALLVTVISALQIRQVQFEFDISELRREGLAFDDLSEEQQELARDSYTPVIVTYDSEEALTAGHARYTAMLEAGELPELNRIISLRTLIPADQEDRLAVLGQIAELSRDENYRYLPAGVRKNLERLVSTPLRPLTPDDLPLGLQNLLGVSGNSWRLLMVPAGNMWDLRETSALLDMTREQITDAPAAGEYLALGTLYQVVRRDMPVVAGLALMLVCLGTLLDLRRPTQAIGAMMVLLSGMAWAGAAIALSGVKLSIVNIVGVPILMGIHLLHRLGEEGPGRVMHALSTTGVAAVLSAMTTVMSFASLTLASSKGIQSLGMLVLVGLSTVTLGAFALLPAGWMTSWKIAGDLPQD